MMLKFRYERGDLVTDLGLGGLPYRVERRLVDQDTGIGLYQLKLVDDNTEIFRNSKLVDDVTRFCLYVASNIPATSSALIQPSPVSKSAPVHAEQARFMASAIEALEVSFEREFGQNAKLSVEEFRRFQILPAYQGFMHAALVCGFVCEDFEDSYPIEAVASQPDRLWNLNFQEIRRYIHTLQRTAKWQSDFSDALTNALRSGALSIVARRLREDQRLYEAGS